MTAVGSWYRRAFTVDRAALDLHDPGQLDLLRRCGPFSTDASLVTRRSRAQVGH